MSRHSKNNTASAVFTYHERRHVEGYGSLKERLGQASQHRFSECWLCMGIAENPVCTPGGYIYCRECILADILNQQKEFRKASEIEEAVLEQLELDALAEANKKLEEQSGVNELLAATESLVLPDRMTAVSRNKRPAPPEEGLRKLLKADTTSTRGNVEPMGAPADPNLVYAKQKKAAAAAASSMILSLEDNTKSKPSPSMGLTGRPTKPTRKKFTPKCPVSGQSFKVRDLINLRPETEVVTNSLDNIVEEKWICSVSKKTLTHQPVTVLKPTGELVLTEFLSSCVYGTPIQNDPNNKKYQPSDTINLVPMETAFAAKSKDGKGETTVKVKHRPAIAQ